jgi:DNA-binding MarR family transcriptional regulator
MTVLPDDFRQRSEGLRRHPRFSDARVAQVAGYMKVFEGKPGLNKLLADLARYTVIVCLLCLAARQREDDPETWLTLARLQDLVGSFQIGSPGFVEAIVARLRDLDMIEQRPAPGDRRKRLLVPTDALVFTDMEILAIQAVPLTFFGANPALEPPLARDRAYHGIHRMVAVDSFAEAIGMVSCHGEMLRIFMNRDSGFMVLLAIEASLAESGDGRGAKVVYQDIADRFGVSRAHVRNIVMDAEAANLLKVTTPGRGELEILPKFRELHDGLMADSFVSVERRFIDAFQRQRRGA